MKSGPRSAQDEAKLAQLRRHVLAEMPGSPAPPRFTSCPPAETVVWRRRASGDAPIKADDPLLDVIRPSEVFIDAVIYGATCSRVKPGDTPASACPVPAESGRPW